MVEPEKEPVRVVLAAILEQDLDLALEEVALELVEKAVLEVNQGEAVQEEPEQVAVNLEEVVQEEQEADLAEVVLAKAEIREEVEQRKSLDFLLIP